MWATSGAHFRAAPEPSGADDLFDAALNPAGNLAGSNASFGTVSGGTATCLSGTAPQG